MNKDKIREEFFEKYAMLKGPIPIGHAVDIADFWLQILDRELLALKEEVKGVKKKQDYRNNQYNAGKVDGYNSAIEDIINLKSLN